MMKKFLFIIFLLGLQTSFAQTKVQNLEQAYQAFTADAQTKHAINALVVLDATTGKTLFANNAEIGLATASTLKTITAATAFYLLGKDYTYETSLAYSGTIDAEGTLKGDLIIVGSGDPTLASARFPSHNEQAILNQWIKAINTAGIKKIEGRVIGDDQWFDTQSVPDGWIWQDIGNYYGAGTSGLSWRENQFDIYLKPGKSFAAPVDLIKTQPHMPYLKFNNELKTGTAGSGDDAYAYLPPYSNLAYLRGSWGVDIKKLFISASVPDPAFDAAYRLQDTLNKVGITTSQSPTTTRLLSLETKTKPAIAQTIAKIKSPNLSEMVYWFLKKSVNLYGETFLKTIALKNNKLANTQNGIDTEINFWASKGLDKTSLNIKDGSGLSPGNKVTANAMANILFQIQKETWFSDFYKALPEYNGMKIKSGTINDVSAFAGYHTDRNGRKYVIVINTNNYSGSGINKKLFKVLDALK